ncbi:MAG: hypothetical protein ABIL05_00950, partial [candidate division WOR-3 bacterium]
MRKKWTPERVLEEIMVIYRKGKPLSSGYAIKHYPSLYHGARGRFGSWPKAIEACGIDYDSVRKVRTWTKDKIIREIKRLQKTGLGLASSDLDRYYPKLKSAAKKHFGGLSQAYAAAGIAYKKIRKTKEWSEYLVLKTLRKLIRKRMIKRLKQFRDEYPSLY